METKLAELTEKIYREGIEKSEVMQKDMLETATKEAVQIKEKAEQDAAKIIAAAEKKSEELRRNCESDIKLSSTQALNSLKQQITNIVMSEALDNDIKDVMNGKELLENSIIEIAKNWDDKSVSLEVLLSEKNQKELSKSMESKVKKVLDSSITLNVSKNINSGFKIGPEGGTYKLSLTDEDFAEFFKEYLRPTTRKLLFEE